MPLFRLLCHITLDNWNKMVALICISLMTDDTVTFSHANWPLNSFLVKQLFTFLHILIKHFIFQLVVRILYYSGFKSFKNMWLPLRCSDFVPSYLLFFFSFPSCLLFFWDKVSLCHLCWLPIPSPPESTFTVLWLRVCYQTMLRIFIYYLSMYICIIYVSIYITLYLSTYVSMYLSI